MSGRSCSIAPITSSIDVVDVDPGQSLGLELQRQRALGRAGHPQSLGGVERAVEQLGGALGVARRLRAASSDPGQVDRGLGA